MDSPVCGPRGRNLIHVSSPSRRCRSRTVPIAPPLLQGLGGGQRDLVLAEVLVEEREETAQVERFGEVVGGAGLAEVADLALGRVRGDDDDGDARRCAGSARRRWRTTLPGRSGRWPSSRMRSGWCCDGEFEAERRLQRAEEPDPGAVLEEVLDESHVGEVVLDVEQGARSVGVAWRDGRRRRPFVGRSFGRTYGELEPERGAAARARCRRRGSRPSWR